MADKDDSAQRIVTARGRRSPYLDGWSLGPAAAAFGVKGKILAPLAGATTATGSDSERSIRRVSRSQTQGTVTDATASATSGITAPAPRRSETSPATAATVSADSGNSGATPAAVAVGAGIAAAGAAVAHSAARSADTADHTNTNTNTNTKTATSQETVVETDTTKSTISGSTSNESIVMDRAEPAGRTTVSETTRHQEPVHAGAPPARGGGSLLSTIALLLSLLALGAAGYLFYRNEAARDVQVSQQMESVGVAAQVDVVKERFEGVKTDVKDIDGKVAKVREELTSFKSTVDDGFSKIRTEDLATVQQGQAEGVKQVGALRADVDKLSGSMDDVYDKLDRSLGEWQLQEVEQLLITANDRLSLSGDVAIASSALALADERLADINDPGLGDVRAALAEEKQALGGIEVIDVMGLAARVRALHNGVEKLPLRETPRLMGSAEEEAGVVKKDMQDAEPAKSDDGASDAPASGWLESKKWKALGKDVLNDLKGTVNIQKAGESRAPLMSPDQRFFLFQNLKLLLNSAQLSLLQSDEQGFQGNLKNAGDWVGTYFVADAKPVTSAMSEISELAGTKISQELPDISGSLSALRKVIETRAAK